MADFLQRARGLGKAAFDRQTPERYRLAGNDPSMLAQLSTIDNRSGTLKEKARKHFAKYEETWVVKEAIGLLDQRLGNNTMPNLPASAKRLTRDSMMQEARRNVHARMTNRLTKINGISTRMTNSVIRNAQKRSVENSPSAKVGDASPKKGSPSR